MSGTQWYILTRIISCPNLLIEKHDFLFFFAGFYKFRILFIQNMLKIFKSWTYCYDIKQQSPKISLTWMNKKHRKMEIVSSLCKQKLVFKSKALLLA